VEAMRWAWQDPAVELVEALSAEPAMTGTFER
jgi:hypothetical protein